MVSAVQKLLTYEAQHSTHKDEYAAKEHCIVLLELRLRQDGTVASAMLRVLMLFAAAFMCTHFYLLPVSLISS